MKVLFIFRDEESLTKLLPVLLPVITSGVAAITIFVTNCVSVEAAREVAELEVYNSKSEIVFVDENFTDLYHVGPREITLTETMNSTEILDEIRLMLK